LPILTAARLESVSPPGRQEFAKIEGEQASPDLSYSSANAPAGLDGHRVLIVDDEKDARDMLQIMLTQLGAEIKASQSAQEALLLLEQWHPDVLVSDIGMPEEDGYFLIERVRALDSARGGEIPAIALTGYASSAERQKLLSFGYQIHLSKPVDIEQLVNAIVRLAKTHEESVTFHKPLPDLP
jgi:CheY-like chemotaxis protein